MTENVLQLPPRFVVAAPRSGTGKTTVSTGLMAALSRRGLDVSCHKVGPDYIDPGYHSLACGRPGRNLDAYLVGEERIAPLLAHGSRGADVAVIEGVMGLFDGVAHQADFASTGHVARLTDSPVIFVMDAGGASHSVAALVHGFRTWDPRVNVAGVIFTLVASDRHEALLRDAMEHASMPVLGALRRDPALAVPSRHLGLIPVGERAPEVVEWMDTLAVSVEKEIDLDAVLAIARTAPATEVTPWTAPTQQLASRPVIAVAGGAAFTFGYTEQLEALTAAGADVVVFDPLNDRALPRGTQGLILGGGFPEVYADQLQANVAIRQAIAALIDRGGVVYAECAGMLWLLTALEGRAMVGAIDAQAAMGPRLTLGYREATAAQDSAAFSAGAVIRAHEFHRTQTTPAAGPAAAWWVNGQPHGWSSETLVASYLHLHWAGLPEAALRFVRRCAEVAV